MEQKFEKENEALPHTLFGLAVDCARASFAPILSLDLVSGRLG